MADWPLSLCVTRPNRVRLRYGSRVHLTRLRVTDYSAPRGFGYLLNGQLQGKLLAAYKISQAYPGAPYIALFAMCAVTEALQGGLRRIGNPLSSPAWRDKPA